MNKPRHESITHDENHSSRVQSTTAYQYNYEVRKGSGGG